MTLSITALSTTSIRLTTLAAALAAATLLGACAPLLIGATIGILPAISDPERAGFNAIARRG